MSSFVGRTREIEILRRRAVGAGDVIALVGPSGVGKSTIARAWAREVDAEWIDCFSRTPAEVVADLQRHDEPGAVVLDDLEASAIATVAPHVNGPLVVTTQEVPDSDDVRVLPIRPIDLSTPDGEEEALGLFVEAACDIDMSFDLSDEDRVLVQKLVRRFDGYPLAIALAGRRAAVVTTKEVVRAVEEGGDVVDGSMPLRHTSLSSALALTWTAISRELKAIVFAMSLFRRPLRVDALARVLNRPLAEVEAGVTQLVQGGLVPPAAYPRPLEALADYAVGMFRGQSGVAAEIEARTLERAVAAAEDVPRGMDYALDYGDGPSLWIYYFENVDFVSRTKEEVARVLSGYLRWTLLADSGVGEEIVEALRHADDWDAWLQYARVASRTSLSEAVDLVNEEVLPRAKTDEQRHVAKVALAGFQANQMQMGEANEALEEAWETGDSLLSWVYSVMTSTNLWERKEKVQAVERARELLADDSTIEQQTQVALAHVWVGLGENLSTSQLAARCEKAIDLAKRSRALRLIAMAHMVSGEGFAFATKSDAERASHHFREARKFYKRERGSYPAFAAISVSLEAFGWLRAGEIERAHEVMGELTEALRGSDELLANLMRVFEAALNFVDGDPKNVDPLLEAAEGWTPVVKTIHWLWVVTELGRRLERGDAAAADRLVLDATTEDPAIAPLLEKQMLLSRVHPRSTSGQIVEGFEAYRSLREGFGESVAHVALVRYWDGRVPDSFERLAEATNRSAGLVVLDDFSAFWVAGEWTSLESKTLARRMLEVLVEADEPLDFDVLADALYPDETLTYDSLVNRINVQVSRLRKEGLGSVLAKSAEGFFIDAEVARVQI